MKRVFVIHRWDGTPQSDWYPWLKTHLEKQGLVVNILVMPHPEEPRIEEWVSYLKSTAASPDNETYFIGHSIGCQTIMRYLAALPTDRIVGGAIFVAGWLHLVNLSDANSKAIASPWLTSSIDFGKVKEHLPKLFALFSDDDPWVPLTDIQLFEKYLGATTKLLQNHGHFTSEDGIKQLPEVLNTFSSRSWRG